MRTKQLDCRFKTNNETDDLQEGDSSPIPARSPANPTATATW